MYFPRGLTLIDVAQDPVLDLLDQLCVGDLQYDVFFLAICRSSSSWYPDTFSMFFCVSMMYLSIFVLSVALLPLLPSTNVSLVVPFCCSTARFFEGCAGEGGRRAWLV